MSVFLNEEMLESIRILIEFSLSNLTLKIFSNLTLKILSESELFIQALFCTFKSQCSQVAQW
jgi:hypothetical protein